MVAFTSIRPADAAAYRRDAAAFKRALHAVAGDLDWYTDKFTPYPLLLDTDELNGFAALRAALDRAIVRVVESYFDDARIRRILALPQDHLALLARAYRRPYRIGSFRPDLLLDEAGVWRVCEVNARFPVNGYLVSHYINRVAADLDYLAGSGARPLPGVARLVDAIAGRFRAGEPLVVVKEREKGMDIFLLLGELERRGISPRIRAPGRLACREGRVFDGAEAVDQFVLELERDELLAMDPALFDALAERDHYFNDLRTLLLSHDKRMLAVLSDPEIMADYLDDADRGLLARHLIPTYNAADPRIAARLRAVPSEWVLKRNSSGRGIGMLIGRECEPAAWRQAVTGEADDYTAQAYVPQRRLPVPILQGDALAEQEMNVVAILPGFDGELLGPGFFRASIDSIINVHGGRGTIVPALLAG